MEAAGQVFWVFGMIVSFVGGIWFLIVAFKESILWGLGCFFLFPLSLVFLVIHWNDTKRPFFTQLTGIVLVILGMKMRTGF